MSNPLFASQRARKVRSGELVKEKAVTESISPRTARRQDRVRQVLAARQNDLTLVLSNIHDAHNVSAIYRSCDAFGLSRVHLHYTDTAFPVLGAKSSASGRKWVESVRHSSADSLLRDLRQGGFRVLAACCSSTAEALDSYDLTGPTAFILGNEHRGLEPALAALADAEVLIPMYGMIQSLNVSVAAAVLLAEAARQRRKAGRYARPSLSQEDLERLYAVWIRR
jgi:tRNA (guanosine-2'-O-)-methyltransferase